VRLPYSIFLSNFFVYKTSIFF